jgi:anti-sigma factor RsiW
MDYEAQLNLQAYLDGELPEAEARVVARQLAEDREAAALLEELRQTRQAVRGSELSLRLPESREFFWSKISREIERRERPALEPASAPLMVRLRRLLMPAAAVAVVAIGLLLVLRPGAGLGGVQTALAAPGTMIYRDDSARATFVWLSYPAENEVAEEDDTGTLN